MKSAKFFSIFLTFSLFAAFSASADDYVIVGTKNTLGEEVTDINDLRAVFMGEKLFWNDNVRILTIFPDFSHSSTLAFSQQVLGVDHQQYGDYWRRKLFAGKGHPPREVENDDQALELVRTNHGAIAILSHDPSNTEGLTILKVDPKSNRIFAVGR